MAGSCELVHLDQRTAVRPAELRLGFGRIDSTRDTVITRVTKGTLGIKNAVRQVEEFRRLKRTARS